MMKLNCKFLTNYCNFFSGGFNVIFFYEYRINSCSIPVSIVAVHFKFPCGDSCVDTRVMKELTYFLNTINAFFSPNEVFLQENLIYLDLPHNYDKCFLNNGLISILLSDE